MRNVLEFGAVGDGVTDDRDAVQSALDLGGDIYFPTGLFRISDTLRVPSHTHLHLEPTARLIFSGFRRKRANEYLLTNSDHEGGNEDISISGGVFDGNNSDPLNDKPDIDDLTGYSGTVLNFYRVKNLVLTDITVANSVTYNVRMARIDGFRIENIGFLSDRPAYNQDGLHFNGFVKNGVVKNVRALSDGQTNDDMLAFNADDMIGRVENVGMECGDIENIEVDGVFAANCYTAIRLLSVNSAIRNVHIKNVCCGFRTYAINSDAARYCKRPVFREEDYPMGVGKIENVTVENMTVWCTAKKPKTPAAIQFETLAQDFSIHNFRFVPSEDSRMTTALLLTKVTGTRAILDGEEHRLTEMSDRLEVHSFKDLQIRYESLK